MPGYNPGSGIIIPGRADIDSANGRPQQTGRGGSNPLQPMIPATAPQLPPEGADDFYQPWRKPAEAAVAPVVPVANFAQMNEDELLTYLSRTSLHPSHLPPPFSPPLQTLHRPCAPSAPSKGCTQGGCCGRSACLNLDWPDALNVPIIFRAPSAPPLPAVAERQTRERSATPQLSQRVAVITLRERTCSVLAHGRLGSCSWSTHIDGRYHSNSATSRPGDEDEQHRATALCGALWRALLAPCDVTLPLDSTASRKAPCQLSYTPHCALTVARTKTNRFGGGGADDDILFA